MAFSFFRKRQKLIFVIMVVLMVSFLIGFQGLSMIFKSDPGKEPFGTTRYGELTRQEVSAAQAHLGLLREFADGFGINSPMFVAWQALTMGNEENSVALAYAMLQKEARARNHVITEREIDITIEQLKANGLPFDQRITLLRQNQNIPLKQVRSVLAGWLSVYKTYRASNVLIPPSQKQLRELFVDLNEQIGLEVLTVSAKAMLDKIGQPSDEQITEQFNEYRNRAAWRFNGLESFPFGYLLPPRAQIQYLFIDRQPIARAAVPSDEEIARWIDGNPEALGGVAPDDYATSRAIARRELKGQIIQTRFQQVLGKVQATLRELVDAEATTTGPSANLYAQAESMLTLPADDLLTRKVPVVAIRQQPLHEAIDTLAKLTDPPIQSICFPTGKHGQIEISPTLKVTLVGRDMTLAEALEKIASQVKDLPPLKWACFEGLDEVIFPVEGVRFFPVRAGQTLLADADTLSAEPLLAGAMLVDPNFRRRPVPLLAVAFQVDPLVEDGSLRIGQPGPIMDVYGERTTGQLLWEVSAARPSEAPAEMTDAIRAKVIDDWRLAQAWTLAVKQAEQITTPQQMVDWAKAHDDELIDTGLFARRQQYALGLGAYQRTRVPKLNFSDRQNLTVDAFFADKVFDALSPKELSSDYPKLGTDVLAVPLKCELYTAVARRNNFRPAMQDEYRQIEPELVRTLQTEQRFEDYRQWFAWPQVKLRTGFEPVE